MKNSKICNTCGIEKSVNEFHKRKDSHDGLRNDCKKCTRIRINLYRVKNKDKVNEWNRGTYHKHIEKHKLTKKLYRDRNKNKEKLRRKKYRETNEEKIKNYFKVNKIKILKKTNERLKIRKKNDVLFRLICSMRSRTNGFLKKMKIDKKNKTFHIIGCEPIFLKKYLEERFIEGMCWDNYGKKGWSIDHIIPLSSAKNEEEILKLCHYTNLRPMWEIDNIKKSNKIVNGTEQLTNI